MSYVRLSVPVDRSTVDAARRLREWIHTPGFSDLCAGVKSLDVGTLERLHGAVSGLYFRTQEMTEVARGDRYPVDEGPSIEYSFFLNADPRRGIFTVKWRAKDLAGAKVAAGVKYNLPAAGFDLSTGSEPNP